MPTNAIGFACCFFPDSWLSTVILNSSMDVSTKESSLETPQYTTRRVRDPSFGCGVARMTLHGNLKDASDVDVVVSCCLHNEDIVASFESHAADHTAERQWAVVVIGQGAEVTAEDVRVHALAV